MYVKKCWNVLKLFDGIEAKKMDKSLKEKGFVVESSHHKYYRYYTISEKKTHIKTKMSHGSRRKDIDKNLESYMAQQCKLSTGDFRKLIECSIDRVAYEELIKRELSGLEKPSIR